MIIRGGENIYPKEIENALATHDDVLEAAVIGAPHDVYGEVPVAYVVTYPDTAVTHDVLAEHLSSGSRRSNCRWRSTSSTRCPATPSARSTSRDCGAGTDRNR